MTKKQYYVHYYRDAANTYRLYWAASPEQIALAESRGYERITRTEAIRLCKAEADRRNVNSTCGAAYPIHHPHSVSIRSGYDGFADPIIFPIDLDRENPWADEGRVYLSGYVLDYIASGYAAVEYKPVDFF